MIICCKVVATTNAGHTLRRYCAFLYNICLDYGALYGHHTCLCTMTMHAPLTVRRIIRSLYLTIGSDDLLCTSCAGLWIGSYRRSRGQVNAEVVPVYGQSYRCTQPQVQMQLTYSKSVFSWVFFIAMYLIIYKVSLECCTPQDPKQSCSSCKSF